MKTLIIIVPLEIIKECLKFVKKSDLFAISLSGKFFHSLIHSDVMYHEYCRRLIVNGGTAFFYVKIYQNDPKQAY